MDIFERRCVTLLKELSLISSEDEVLNVEKLVGGVASDIGVATLADRKVCVKFALAKLKVSADWRAPVHRNRAEFAWLEFASSVVPDAVPRLLGWSAAENGFAMEFIEGADVRQWKGSLLSYGPGERECEAVASVSGAIHSASTKAGFDRGPFENRDDFKALRLEPYLLYTADRYPALSAAITRAAEDLYESELALVHGDVSPKNILFRGRSPILLDAECATMGDPAFDVAFCLNHLLLKALHLPAYRRAFLLSAGSFWATYRLQVDWESSEMLEGRVSRLLPMLLLARVDGKSPVEYLSEANRDEIRHLAPALIIRPPSTLQAVLQKFE